MPQNNKAMKKHKGTPSYLVCPGPDERERALLANTDFAEPPIVPNPKCRWHRLKPDEKRQWIESGRWPRPIHYERYIDRRRYRPRCGCRRSVVVSRGWRAVLPGVAERSGWGDSKEDAYHSLLGTIHWMVDLKKTSCEECGDKVDPVRVALRPPKQKLYCWKHKDGQRNMPRMLMGCSDGVIGLGDVAYHKYVATGEVPSEWRAFAKELEEGAPDYCEVRDIDARTPSDGSRVRIAGRVRYALVTGITWWLCGLTGWYLPGSPVPDPMKLADQIDKTWGASRTGLWGTLIHPKTLRPLSAPQEIVRQERLKIVRKITAWLRARRGKQTYVGLAQAIKMRWDGPAFEKRIKHPRMP